MVTAACMGGWCRIRNRCPHYTQVQRGPEDAERLCPAGRDGAAVDATADSIRPTLRARTHSAAFPAANAEASA